MTYYSSHRTRLNRVTYWGAFGALSFVSVLVLAAPATMGLTYTPPYTHVHQSKVDWLKETTGCASLKSTTPNFDPLTGNASWKGKVKVGNCAKKFQKAFTNNLAQAEGATELSIPVLPRMGGAHAATFNVTWNITAAGNIAQGGISPCIDPLPANSTGSYECIALAISSLIGNAWLVDLTNGTVTMASNSPIVSGIAAEYVNYTVCSPVCGSFAFGLKTGTSFSGPQTDTFTINATTNPTHKYAIVTYVGGMAAAELVGYTGHASAFVDMGSTGFGAQLVSIVET